jgi:hypothetical protein
VHRHATGELHVEMPLAQRAPPPFPHRRKRLGQQVVQVFAIVEPLAEHRAELAQLGVRTCLHLAFEVADRAHHRLRATKVLPRPDAEELGQDHELDASLEPAGRVPARPACTVYGPEIV